MWGALLVILAVAVLALVKVMARCFADRGEATMARRVKHNFTKPKYRRKYKQRTVDFDAIERRVLKQYS